MVGLFVAMPLSATAVTYQSSGSAVSPAPMPQPVYVPLALQDKQQGESTADAVWAETPSGEAPSGELPTSITPRSKNLRKSDAETPWTIHQPSMLKNLGIETYGWIQQGITSNAVNPASRFNGPVACNDRAGEYQLNQFWLGFKRPTDGTYGLDVGGTLDLVYGTDWRYAYGNGMENRINAMDQLYGLTVAQIYGEVAYGDLTVRLGRMAASLGYEQVPAVANFFYSHSYSLCYGEPILITGVVADYQLTDRLVLQGGFHQGWFMWEDVNQHKDFIGGFRWSTEDQSTQFAYHLTTGDQSGLIGLPTKNWYAHSIVFQQQLTRNARYVLQSNLGYADDLYLSGHAAQDAEWYSIAQYLFYDINKKWRAGMRIEWFRDSDGMAVKGLKVLDPQFRAWDGIGYSGDFYELTFGLNWRPNSNWVIRPECRWDWYDGPGNGGTPSGPYPFDDGASKNQFTFAVDAIFTF
jgi:hypothetical protein